MDVSDLDNGTLPREYRDQDEPQTSTSDVNMEDDDVSWATSSMGSMSLADSYVSITY